MHLRVRIQLAEALGPVNRWYCSQAYGYDIDDPERLLTYFIKSGGAEDFAVRYEQAMGMENRWYCSEYYRRDIREPEILWHYYVNCPSRRMWNDCERESADSPAELSMAG